jgi:hypothetical protein
MPEWKIRRIVKSIYDFEKEIYIYLVINTHCLYRSFAKSEVNIKAVEHWQKMMIHMDYFGHF